MEDEVKGEGNGKKPLTLQTMTREVGRDERVVGDGDEEEDDRAATRNQTCRGGRRDGAGTRRRDGRSSG